MNPITIPNISIPSIGIPTIGIPSVGFPSASGGGGLSWPAGMKEHIKAWYDPKKQGMTNFDVIEAYVEDFSKNPWNNKTEKYVGNLTSKALTVTEVLVRRALIYTNIKPYNFKVRITGLINNQKVIFGDDTSAYRALIVDKDGIYDINWEDNHRAYCIWMDFIGECNITITQLPTSILKDFSGNGNHAYLYGGKGKLNSGMGVYGIDVTENIIQPNRFEYLYDNITKEITFIKALSNGTYLFNINKNIVNSTQQIKFEGIDSPIRFINYTTNETYYNITEDGIYDIEFVTDANTIISTNYTTNQEFNLKVQFLPYYPDQLCYDGKMYAVCYGFPILTDYTVMAERTWFDTLSIDKTFISKRNTDNSVAAFLFEKISGVKRRITVSFGINNDIEFVHGISYQSKNSYNGTIIKSGNAIDSDTLVIGGSIQNGLFKELWTGCHGAIIVADRSFTEEEINWLKQNWDKI